MIQSLQWDDLVETACARQPRWTPGGSDSGEWAHSSPGLTEREKSLGQPSCGMEADSSLCGRHLLTCMRRENVWHQSAKLKLEVGWIYRFEGIPAGTGQSGGLGPPDLPFIPLQAALRLRPRRAVSSVGAKRKLTRRGMNNQPLMMIS